MSAQFENQKIPTKQEMKEALTCRVGNEITEKLNNATVAVMGLGGLGSNISIALARAGVGHLILADFDCVDLTNLNRQQYKASQLGQKKTEALKENLLEIAPYLKIDTFDVKVNEENLSSICAPASVICEAFDKAENKAMLVNYVLENMSDKYLVAASGLAGFKSLNQIKTRRISQKFFLCGDGTSDVNNGIGLVSARVMGCAAHQALTVLKILIDDISGDL